MDPMVPEAYGAPYCGDCGKGRKGFCGGGGYIISQRSLLRMASLDEPLTDEATAETRKKFVAQFVHEPSRGWCDVRFACVAQDQGLRLVGVRGLEGNGYPDDPWARTMFNDYRIDPPLIVHNVKNATYMKTLHRWSSEE